MLCHDVLFYNFADVLFSILCVFLCICVRLSRVLINLLTYLLTYLLALATFHVIDSSTSSVFVRTLYCVSELMTHII